MAQSTETSITAYAGINSSQASQDAGKNEHFRSFRIDLPPRRAAENKDATLEKSSLGEGKTEALGRASFFKTSTAPKKETYQRITRVSPVGRDSTHRIAAIATGLAAESEIVVLRAVANPQDADELARISLDKNEAADLDITGLDNEASDYLLAFCTDTEVYTQKISNSKAGLTEEATFIYGVAPPDSSAGSTGKIKNRSLCFLTPRHILLLQNLPQRSGAELLLLKLGESGEPGMVMLQKRLSGITKVAVGMDICELSHSPTGDFQIIVAVAGQTGSIEILSLECSPSKGLSTFKPHVTLKEVHGGSITRLTFSTFLPPELPVTKDTPPQYVKLASVSVAQTVVVHTLPLSPYPLPTSKARTPRYVLASPGSSDATQAVFSVFMAVFVIGIAAFLLQAFTEIRGGVPPYLGAADWLSPGMKQLIHRPYMFANVNNPVLPSDIASVATVTQKLKDIVDEHATAETPKSIVVREGDTGELSTEVHHGEEVVQGKTLRKWEDLQEHEQEDWKRKLSDAGHWTASQGENVLQGIFFSEWAGLVGEIVGGA